MTIEWAYVVGGAAVGLVVGLTGVGGGSLMTPLLIYGFGVQPHLAVGTDLLFAALTKSAGAVSFARHRLVPWRVVAQLTGGGLLGAAVMLVALAHWGAANPAVHAAMKVTLGIMLWLTAAATAYKVIRAGWWWRSRADTAAARAVAHASVSLEEQQRPRWAWGPWLMGATIGALVTLTSVGAGAVGVAVLMLLYPQLPLARLVAADVTYAVPLTLVAGLGHAALGSVDWGLLAWLLTGSLPGIWLGSRLVSKAPVTLVRSLLSLLLAWVGFKLVSL
ncbi:Sulfite exporter TauE/SafE [Tepidimonas alkaliphilus]|uniref:Probable membrane transporter protein n=1 Tax=Tepidimonas alkaliphilus TaxID=2588942 RepID=A0A554WBF2_9BURK|nr:sulfite exporter TauE/SafE family protein [Tepidimonas alkaliphilus]TSE20901.1 Sulfite exporter TauE/SafE [Tepidimonas alkaliphilus]